MKENELQAAQKGVLRLLKIVAYVVGFYTIGYIFQDYLTSFLGFAILMLIAAYIYRFLIFLGS